MRIKGVPMSLGPKDINALYGLNLVDLEEFGHLEHISGLNEAMIARMCPFMSLQRCGFISL